jgi:7-cyano-7-deazaguanine reductase
MDARDRGGDFVALGHSGSTRYAGLEIFENPGVTEVEMTSDELVALGPVNEQPDMYTVTIRYAPDRLCLESKSLKLYLMQYRNEEVFCEALAVKIRDDVAGVLGLGAEAVRVELTQKARGGITITTTAADRPSLPGVR